eukprot:1742355-Amphidinium_carterae.3
MVHGFIAASGSLGCDVAALGDGYHCHLVSTSAVLGLNLHKQCRQLTFKCVGALANPLAPHAMLLSTYKIKGM